MHIGIKMKESRRDEGVQFLVKKKVCSNLVSRFGPEFQFKSGSQVESGPKLKFDKQS